jgi:hypothetical protein
MIPNRIAYRIADDDPDGSTSDFSRRKLLSGAVAGPSLAVTFCKRKAPISPDISLDEEVEFLFLIKSRRARSMLGT